MSGHVWASLAVSAVLLGSCASDTVSVADGDSDPETSLNDGDSGEQFPDVVGVDATYNELSDAWTFDVTLSSPYDSPERYADGWRVVGPDGTVFKERILTHDHASEQPFTRSQSGIEIPVEVASVTVQGRDQQSGYGGTSMIFDLVRAES